MLRKVCSNILTTDLQLWSPLRYVGALPMEPRD
jgi:hypothetical protein